MRKKSPARALAEIEREVRQGLNPVAESSKESVELMKVINPGFFDNMERYIRSPIRKQESGGKLDVMPELLTATLNHFTFSAKDLQQLLKPSIFQHKSYLYNSIEARYKKNVVSGKGGRESFLHSSGFDYWLKRIGYNETITQVMGSILYFDEYDGVILRYSKRFEEIKRIIVDTYWGNVDIVLPDGKIVRVMENRRLLGKWVVGDKNNTKNTDGANIHRKIEIKPTKAQLEKNPNLKPFNMRSSHAMAISCYGFEIAKYLIGSASLLSTYYKDRNSQNISKDNLMLICRVENTKANKINDWHYNWVGYSIRLVEDRINEKDKLYYIKY